MTAAPMKTKEKQIERTAADHARFHNDMQRIAVKLIQHPEALSKGESAHKPKHPELITADMLGAGHLECAEAIEHLTAERDRLREQVKELLAACKLAFEGLDTLAFKLIEATGKPIKLGTVNMAYDAIRAAIASVEADKQGGKQ